MYWSLVINKNLRVEKFLKIHKKTFVLVPRF